MKTFIGIAMALLIAAPVAARDAAKPKREKQPPIKNMGKMKNCPHEEYRDPRRPDPLSELL